MNRIDAFLETVQHLPPAPHMLPQLLAALANPDTDINRVVDMVTFDAALTAKLVHICNSAFFAGSTPIDTVSEAVNRLGFQQVYQVVAAMAGVKCFGTPAAKRPSGRALWRHSVKSAFAALFVAEDVGAATDLIFTAGLLHDLGEVVLSEADSSYDAMQTRSQDGALESERSLYGVNHAEVGARLLEGWRFSPQLVASVLHHHDPQQCGVDARLAACVNLADAVARSTTEHVSEKPAYSLARPAAFEILGLGEKEISRHKERLRENLEFVEAMCQLRN